MFSNDLEWHNTWFGFWGKASTQNPFLIEPESIPNQVRSDLHDPESTQNRTRIDPASTQHPSRIDPESTPKRPRLRSESTSNPARIQPESIPNRPRVELESTSIRSRMHHATIHIRTRIEPESTPNPSRNPFETTPNRPRIHPESTRNRLVDALGGLGGSWELWKSRRGLLESSGSEQAVPDTSAYLSIPPRFPRISSRIPSDTHLISLSDHRAPDTPRMTPG